MNNTKKEELAKLNQEIAEMEQEIARKEKELGLSKLDLSDRRKEVDQKFKELNDKFQKIIASKLKLYEGVTGDSGVVCYAYAHSLKEAIPIIQAGYEEKDDGLLGSFTFTEDSVAEVVPKKGFYQYFEILV